MLPKPWLIVYDSVCVFILHSTVWFIQSVYMLCILEFIYNWCNGTSMPDELCLAAFDLSVPSMLLRSEASHSFPDLCPHSHINKNPPFGCIHLLRNGKLAPFLWRYYRCWVTEYNNGFCSCEKMVLSVNFKRRRMLFLTLKPNTTVTPSQSLQVGCTNPILQSSTYENSSSHIFAHVAAVNYGAKHKRFYKFAIPDAFFLCDFKFHCHRYTGYFAPVIPSYLSVQSVMELKCFLLLLPMSHITSAHYFLSREECILEVKHWMAAGLK